MPKAALSPLGTPGVSATWTVQAGGGPLETIHPPLGETEMEASRGYMVCPRSQSEQAAELEPEAWSDPGPDEWHSAVNSP